MKETKKQTIVTDVKGKFLQDISLWSIHGNNYVVKQLKILVNEYHNNKSQGRNQKIKNIIISGKNNTGKTTLAYAYSNSLCCSHLYEADGSTLSMGGECITRFLQKGDGNSSFLITSAEKLSQYCCYILNGVLQTNILNK